MEKEKLTRKSSLRLKGFDYSSECLYYITICIYHYLELFGKITADRMYLNKIGNFARYKLLELENYYDTVAIDEYVIMPNHLHVILFISKDEENIRFVKQNRIDTENLRAMKHTSVEKCRGLIYLTQNYTYSELKTGSMNRTPTLGNIIRDFKASTSYQLHIQGIKYFKWQRNFHDHVIRNEKDYTNIKNYIFNNPLNWSNEQKRQDY